MLKFLIADDHPLLREALIGALQPHFKEVKKAVLKEGALGAGISGSGPSIFSLSKSEQTALKVKDTMSKIYSKTEIEFEIHVSKINTEGVKIK